MFILYYDLTPSKQHEFPFKLKLHRKAPASIKTDLYSITYSANVKVMGTEPYASSAKRKDAGSIRTISSTSKPITVSRVKRSVPISDRNTTNVRGESMDKLLQYSAESPEHIFDGDSETYVNVMLNLKNDIEHIESVDYIYRQTTQYRITALQEDLTTHEIVINLFCK